MADDYADRIAALVPPDVLDRYLTIKHRLVEIRDERWALEQELLEIGRRFGVPDIDYPAAASNQAIRQDLGANLIEINSVWVAAPGGWRCPCCARTKPQCARLGTKGQLLGKLTAHHDHFEDLMDVVLSELSAEMTIAAASSSDARRFIRRGLELLTRFDRVIICEDCNNVEAVAKKSVGAPPYFTFTPQEIAGFVVAVPNRSHEVNVDALAATYAVAKVHYERREGSLRRLAELALKGSAWYEPVAFEDLDDQLSRRVGMALSMFGLKDAGPGTLEAMFFQRRKIDPKHASAWRRKAPEPATTPNENQIAFVIRGNKRFEALAADWSCPCCARGKRDAIRWSRGSKQFIFATYVRNVPDDAARYGKRSVEMCDACGNVFRECSKEINMTFDGPHVPECPFSMDDIRPIIRPRPHGMHEIDVVAAQALMDALRSRFEIE